MAFVTYVLIIAVIHGLESRFHPELLGLTASRALAIILVEFALVKLGCYLLNIQGDHTMVDLIAYGGYKFVGTLVTLCVGLLGFEGVVYWGVFFYTFAANAFFIVSDPVGTARSRLLRPLTSAASLVTLRCPPRPIFTIERHHHTCTAVKADPIPLCNRSRAVAPMLGPRRRYL